MTIKQIRYYNTDPYRSLNFPIDVTPAQLSTGHLFSESKEIMIRATEGIKFLINGKEVLIGPVGIYNIPLEEGVIIQSLSLVEESTTDKKEWFVVITFVLNENEE